MQQGTSVQLAQTNFERSPVNDALKTPFMITLAERWRDGNQSVPNLQIAVEAMKHLESSPISVAARQAATGWGVRPDWLRQAGVVSSDHSSNAVPTNTNQEVTTETRTHNTGTTEPVFDFDPAHELKTATVATAHLDAMLEDTPDPDRVRERLHTLYEQQYRKQDFDLAA